MQLRTPILFCLMVACAPQVELDDQAPSSTSPQPSGELRQLLSDIQCGTCMVFASELEGEDWKSLRSRAKALDDPDELIALGLLSKLREECDNELFYPQHQGAKIWCYSGSIESNHRCGQKCGSGDTIGGIEGIPKHSCPKWKWKCDDQR